MSTYSSIEQLACRLNVPRELLQQFVDLGWLSAVEKNGLTFLRADQEYKARFILHLRDRRALSNRQIHKILAVQEPPFSLDGVDVILKKG
jgi:hypothetical protein